MKLKRSDIEQRRGRVKTSVHLSVALPVLSALSVLIAGLIFRIIVIHYLMTGNDISPQQVNMTVNMLLILTLIFSLVAFLAGSILGYVISSPLRRLSELLLQMADKGQAGTIPVQGGDEIALLGHSFNRMVQSMAKYLPERARFIFHNLASGVITTNHEGAIETINAAADKILHLSGKGVVGKKYEEVFAPDSGYEEIAEVLESALEDGESVSDKEITIYVDGDEKHTIGVNTSIAVDPNTQRNAVILTLIDLTWLKNISKQMLQQEKLSAVGSLAAGVAHEVRNPLGALRGLMQMFTQDSISDESRQEYAKVMIKEIDRLNMVVRNLLDFSSPWVDETGDVDLNSMLRRVVELAGVQMLKPEVSVIKHFNEDLPQIQGDESRLIQALLNIVLNALDIVEENGKIEINTNTLPDTDEVEIVIANDGARIPEEFRDRIFDPYFTTKDEGTGLGLTISSQIIAQHGGRIFLKNSEREMTEFAIYLPAYIEHPENGIGKGAVQSQ